jgi:hypothetical protein
VGRACKLSRSGPSPQSGEIELGQCSSHLIKSCSAAAWTCGPQYERRNLKTSGTGSNIIGHWRQPWIKEGKFNAHPFSFRDLKLSSCWHLRSTKLRGWARSVGYYTRAHASGARSYARPQRVRCVPVLLTCHLATGMAQELTVEQTLIYRGVILALALVFAKARREGNRCPPLAWFTEAVPSMILVVDSAVIPGLGR